jgi:hypothetical protein
MVKEAVASFAAKASLTGRFKALPPALRLRCAQVYLLGGNGLCLPDPSAYAKEPLLASLLVFAAQSGPGPGGVRLFGFDEFGPALRPLLAETLAEAGAAGECQAGAQACPWRPLNDVAAVCSLALHGQLKRSAHGGLARSALNALKRVVRDPTLTGKSVSEGAPGHPAGFLIGFCLDESLIEDAGEEYVLDRQRFAAWLEKGMGERLQGFAARAGAFTGNFGLELARALLERAQGRWLSVNQLVPEADRPALERAVGALEFLGRVHTGHGGPSGGLRFAPQKTPGFDEVDGLYAEEPERGALVMPDFSAVIPQEASPSELFGFSNIGLLTAFDKVYKGQITKETVSNALSAGIDAARLRDWLRERRASQNVVKTVDEWIREFSRLFVCRGPVLVSASEKVTRQIASLEPLRRHLAAVDAHAVFSIRPGSEDKVLDVLEKLGFDTRAPGLARGGPADSAKADAGKTHPAKAGVAKAGVAKAGAAKADAEDREDPDGGGRPGPPRKAKRWEPLTGFTAAVSAPAPMNRTKYGSGLKALDIAEMIHVVDYAILTNQALVIDYGGSASIKQNIYTVVPLGIDKGIDAAVEAEIPCVRGRKQFYLAKIKRIGVVAQ